MDGKRMARVVLYCFFCISQSTLASQPASSSSTGSISVPKASAVASAHQASAESLDAEQIALLREQVKSGKEYQNSLLNVVCWSLSGTLAIALLLAGFGWWSNFKIYEADKKRLSEDFEAKLIKLKSDLEVRKLEHRSELEKSMDEKNAQNFERVQQEAQALRAEIPSLRSEFLDRLALVEEPIKDLSKTSAQIEKSVYNLEASLRDVEENIWEMQGLWGNVLLTQGQRVRAASKAGNKYQVEGALRDMVETIEQIVDLKQDIDQDLVRLFTSAVKSASESNPIEVKMVLDALSKVNVINRMQGD